MQEPQTQSLSCDACGQSVKGPRGLSMHKLRKHQGRFWSTRKKQAA